MDIAVRSCRRWARSGWARASLTLLVMALLLVFSSARRWHTARATEYIEHVEGYHFFLSDVVTAPGKLVDFTVKGLHEQSAQGFTLAARYPAEQLTIERVHMEDTILEAIQTDFVEVSVNPQEGFFTVAVLVDAAPPFNGTLIPNIQKAMTFLHFDIEVSDDAWGDLVVRLEDGLSVPPVRNVYVVDNVTEPVTELTEGVIHVTRQVGAFLRGDANMDVVLNVADPIRILEYRFSGGEPPACMDAADGNDDGLVDMSDAIYVLSFLFQGGPAPPPPLGEPGPDATEDPQSCEAPLFLVWYP